MLFLLQKAHYSREKSLEKQQVLLGFPLFSFIYLYSNKLIKHYYKNIMINALESFYLKQL